MCTAHGFIKMHIYIKQHRSSLCNLQKAKMLLPDLVNTAPQSFVLTVASSKDYYWQVSAVTKSLRGLWVQIQPLSKFL